MEIRAQGPTLYRARINPKVLPPTLRKFSELYFCALRPESIITAGLPLPEVVRPWFEYATSDYRASLQP